jgi:hypothetical protein
MPNPNFKWMTYEKPEVYALWCNNGKKSDGTPSGWGCGAETDPTALETLKKNTYFKLHPNSLPAPVTLAEANHGWSGTEGQQLYGKLLNFNYDQMTEEEASKQIPSLKGQTAHTGAVTCLCANQNGCEGVMTTKNMGDAFYLDPPNCPNMYISIKTSGWSKGDVVSTTTPEMCESKCTSNGLCKIWLVNPASGSNGAFECTLVTLTSPNLDIVYSCSSFSGGEWYGGVKSGYGTTFTKL